MTLLWKTVLYSVRLWVGSAHWMPGTSLIFNYYNQNYLQTLPSNNYYFADIRQPATRHESEITSPSVAVNMCVNSINATGN